MSDRDRSDFYKAYKSIRKKLPPEGQVINPKNEYDRRDRSYLKPDVDEGTSEEELDDIYDSKHDVPEHFNLDEWNKKFNAKPIKPIKPVKK